MQENKCCYKKSMSCREVVTRYLRIFVSDGMVNGRKEIRRSRHKSGMTPNLMGFTLIELLVVVLIIGILAAVALPQYQKAVEKSRVATVLAAIKPIVDAEETYYLANGQYTTDIDSLGVDLPAGATPTTTGSKKYNLPNGQQISLDGANDTYGVVCGVTKHVQLDAVLQNSSWSGLPPGGIYCGAFSSDKIGLQVCKSFGSTQKANTLTVGCIINNTQDGCEWYRILL